MNRFIYIIIGMFEPDLTMKIIIINGPNLNLLGKREPDLYGNTSFEEYLEELKKRFPLYSIEHYQSNVEGELINKLHEAGFSCDAIVLNAGGYTHTSVALADAVAAIPAPVIEVHISNIFAREAYRHVSLIGKHCAGSISGFGLKSYELALLAL
jgi:3-dehydroquinate dehydratase II